MSAELFIARRYLVSRRQGAWGLVVSWMAIGSVALGVAALIITLAVMSGFRDDIRSKILGIQPHIMITSALDSFDPANETLSNVLNKNTHVDKWSPYVMSQILIGRGSQSSGGLMKGIVPAMEPQVVNLKGKLLQADWSDLNSNDFKKPGIFLGQELARNIGARHGDTVWIISPGSLGISSLSVPQAHLFVVAGFIQSGLYDYDSSLSYVELSQAQKIFKLKSNVSGIGVRLNNPDNIEKDARALQAAFEGRYWVRSWLSLNKNLFSALKLEKTVMFIILIMITLVSSFMIVSNLLLIITQKVKEIGILRAMGATAGAIQRIFLFQGLIMGVIGTVLGVGLGVGISMILAKTNFIQLPADVYYIDKLPIRIDPMDIVMIVAAALLIVFIATLFPAGKSTKVDPIEAIRYG